MPPPLPQQPRRRNRPRTEKHPRRQLRKFDVRLPRQPRLSRLMKSPDRPHPRHRANQKIHPAAALPSRLCSSVLPAWVRSRRLAEPTHRASIADAAFGLTTQAVQPPVLLPNPADSLPEPIEDCLLPPAPSFRLSQPSAANPAFPGHPPAAVLRLGPARRGDHGRNALRGEITSSPVTAAAIGFLGGLGSIALESAIHLVQRTWSHRRTCCCFSAALRLEILLPSAAGGLLAGLHHHLLRSGGQGRRRPSGHRCRRPARRAPRSRRSWPRFSPPPSPSARRPPPDAKASSSRSAPPSARASDAPGLSARRLRTSPAAPPPASPATPPSPAPSFSVEVILATWRRPSPGPQEYRRPVLATVVARPGAAMPPSSPCPAPLPALWNSSPIWSSPLLCGARPLGVGIRSISFAEHLFDRPRHPPAGCAPPSAVFSSARSLASSPGHGRRPGTCNDAFFSSRFPALLLIALAPAKLLATDATLGSGGSGGAFPRPPSAPSGAFVGTLAESLSSRPLGGIAAHSPSAWAASSPAPCSRPSPPSPH